MPAYHLMGVGKSIGAVTAPLSYLADCKRCSRREFSGRPNPTDGASASLLDALVLFTTSRMADGAACDQYKLNRPGMKDGQTQSGKSLWDALLHVAAADLRALSGAATLPVYLCEIIENDPVETFRRVVQVMRALHCEEWLPGNSWVNLTSGPNVIGGALNLAVSLTGASARLYYTWTEPADTDFARHTVSERDLGGVKDRFWVDAPVAYLSANLARLFPITPRGSADLHASLDRLAGLADTLAARFNRDEWEDLVFRLGLQKDEIAGATDSERSRELVAYCDRHSRLYELVYRMRMQRSDIPWDADLPVDAPPELLILRHLDSLPLQPVRVDTLFDSLLGMPGLPVGQDARESAVAAFKQNILAPLAAQRMIVWHDSDHVGVGGNWRAWRRYYEALREARIRGYLSLDDLAADDSCGWIRVERLKLTPG